ncbi:unnamed protein product [Paramecium sonneborni]|uniref:Myb-like DNA-binding domain protein n=1 Tax=Paramecium sonneborni TaxID=65129 RepID=A0A8S1R7H8_9CILI|nr:unnamed protein product [Paramecium sonneborni]
MSGSSRFQSKKRIPWTEQEDDLLQSFVNIYINQKQAWSKISEELLKKGYLRNPKDCRERFQNYLDSKFNKNKLTKHEVDKLFELISIYGNKWTCIAEKLNNRTDQDVKNQFYAFVKKVYRRLLKASLSNDQKNKSSQITASLRPILISNIFSKNNNNQKYPNISTEMKELFIKLITKNRSIEIGDQLEEDEKKQVIYLSDYLQKENLFYLQNQNQRRSFNQKISTKTKIKDQIQQQKIIKRIKKQKHIFLINNQNFLFKLKMNHQNEITAADDLQQFEPPQIISRPPFQYFNSSNKFNQLYSNVQDYPDTSQGEPFQDTNHHKPIWD